MKTLVFQFDGLTDFMSMSGHGVYVWTAYGIATVVLFLLVTVPIRRRRKFLRGLKNGQKL